MSFNLRESVDEKSGFVLEHEESTLMIRFDDVEYAEPYWRFILDGNEVGALAWSDGLIPDDELREIYEE